MIIIKLQGGLGNQMFQFALASIIAKTNKTKVLIDDNFFNDKVKTATFTPRDFELNIFSNNYNVANEKEIKRFKQLNYFNKIKRKLNLNYPKYYSEKRFDFNPTVLKLNEPVYLEGYFQSYKYFDDQQAFVRNLFAFDSKKLDTQNKELLDKIESKNAIAIHIRRGDYVENATVNTFHGVCSDAYYNNAITEVTTDLKEPLLVFFSDDIDWVKKEFMPLNFDKIFVNHNVNEHSWKDMYLMSRCKHNIIANSSFSWWGAWLNNNPNKIVVAPQNWFSNEEINSQTHDLIPETWKKI